MATPMDFVSAMYRNAPDYDLEYQGRTADIPWLEALCAKYAPGGQVLDLCCGTGRETVALARWAARSGARVTGVDVTPEMLDLCRAKIAAEPPEVQRAVRLVLADIRTMDVGKGSYHFACVPFNSFLHLLTTADQLAALRNIADHLVRGGYFIADIFCPSVSRLEQALGPTWVREELAIEDQATGSLLTRRAVARYDETTQIQNIRFYYEIYELGGKRKLKRAYWSPLSIRMIFPAEWRLLLAAAGFSIVAEWADYAGTPFGQKETSAKSSLMLFLGQRQSLPR